MEALPVEAVKGILAAEFKGSSSTANGERTLFNGVNGEMRRGKE